MTTITTLTTTTAQRAAGAPTPAGTPPTTDPAAANTDVFGPAVKVDLSDEAKGDAASRGLRYIDENGNETFLYGEPLSDERKAQRQKLFRDIAYVNLQSRLISEAAAEQARINLAADEAREARLFEIEATGALELGAIVRDGQVIASINATGGISVSGGSANDDRLVELGNDVAKLGLFRAGPLDLAAIQKRLDAFGPGLSFVDKRTTAGLAYRSQFEAGTFLGGFQRAPSLNSLIPKVTQELVDRLRASDESLDRAFRLVKTIDYEELDAFVRQLASG